MTASTGRTPASESVPDGRVERGARNRAAIVEAVISLVREGDLAPTAGRVAERAGVGARTVFRHFDDMERLHAEVSARVGREVRPLAVAPLWGGTLEERARALVARRVAVYEHIAPFERSGRVHRHASPFLQRTHAETVRELRSNLRRSLPELEGAPDETAQAVEMVTSVEAWDRLRVEQRLSRERARRVMERALLSLLSRLD